MYTHKQSLLVIVSSVLGLALAGMLAFPGNAIHLLKPIWFLQPAPQKTAAFSPCCQVVGKVKLDYALPGIYSDPLPAPDPASNLPELGEVDLGLQLIREDNRYSGYVDIGITLIFTGEHTLDGVAMGPSVSGNFDGATLTLLSEKVSLVSGGVPLQRQFRITGAVLPQSQGNQFSGEYRETVWGYSPQPLTIVGSFTLDWVGPLPGSSTLYLPIILR